MKNVLGKRNKFSIGLLIVLILLGIYGFLLYRKGDTPKRMFMSANVLDGTDRMSDQESPYGGAVSLYVKSLDQSSESILEQVKQLGAIEYKVPQYAEKNQIKTLFLTVPNDKAAELDVLLSKESNNKVVFGSKILYGDFSDTARPKNGMTNFEVRLISLSTLLPPVETSAWKTYNDKERKFSMKYPPDWKFSIGLAGEVFFGFGFGEAHKQVQVTVTDESRSFDEVLSNIDKDKTDLPYSKVVVAGMPAAKFSDGHILFVGNGKRYEVYPEDDDTGYTMLETIRFY